MTDTEARIAAIQWRRRQLESVGQDTIETPAGNLEVGDHMVWGGRLVEVTAIERRSDHTIEIIATEGSWRFPLELSTHEAVNVKRSDDRA